MVFCLHFLMREMGRHGPPDAACSGSTVERGTRTTPGLIMLTPSILCNSQLIALGADIHFINPARDAAGGALHEAAARRNEAVVELLLSAGANPFAANAAGRTALDEAVLAGGWVGGCGLRGLCFACRSLCDGPGRAFLGSLVRVPGQR